MSDIINEIDNDQNLPEEEEESVVVDDGQTYATGESAAIAEAAAAEAKLWAQESERQAGYASSSAIDAVEAKEYAEAAITDPNFVAVATDLSSIPSNIKTVATNISNVNTVASNISNVNAVAGNATNINAVNANKTNIDAVAGNTTNINAVAENATNINAVNANKTNINAVAGNATNINKVAGDINRVKLVADDIESVHTVAVDINNVIDVADNKTNIDTVAGIASDVSAVSTNNANVTAVANNSSNINAVASNSSNINAVAGNATNINAVNANKTNIDKVANNTTNINAVAGNATNINNVAADLTNIDAVAADLTNINNASTYADNAEKWAEGTDGEVTPLGGTHSAKGWAEIAEEAASGVQNPANRDLSNLSSTGQMVIDSQNGTISNCILEIPQNIKLEINGNIITLKSGSVVVDKGATYQTITTTQDYSLTVNLGNLNNSWYYVLNYGNLTLQLFEQDKISSGSTLPASLGGNNWLFFHTTEKIFYQWKTATQAFSTTQYRYPLAMVRKKSSTELEFIKGSNGNNMIFNGAGYIGNCVFALPDIKYLTPSGIVNGKLNSYHRVLNGVKTIEVGASHNFIAIHQNQTLTRLGDYTEVEKAEQKPSSGDYYVKEENLIYTQSNTHPSYITFLKVKKGTNNLELFEFYRKPVRVITDELLENAVSVKENTFKIYQPTFSHEAFGMFFLFVFPDGHNILYDCGYINEENDIDTFLSSLGITHLDVVIVSHFHGDHAGCAPHIINNYCDTNTKFYKCMDCDPSQFTSDQSDVTTYENAYKTALTNKGFTYTIPTNKSSVELFNGTVELTFYNTDTTNLQYYYGTAEMIENLSAGSTANNTSMCCLVRAYGTSVFMTGDIEYAGQKAIADYVPQNVDILQVPHHAVNKNGYAPFFARLNPKVSMFQKNNSTTDQEKKYWWRYMKYNNDIPVINNATTTGIELECYNGNIKMLGGRILSLYGNLDDFNVQCLLPSPYDTVHNADEYATWTIEDVVNMCQYEIKQNFRVGYTYNTTQLISELNTLVPSTSWVITPHIEYITIQDRTDITKAEVKAKSSSDHS